VIGAVSPTGSHAPQVWGKHNDRQKEEDAGNFEPQNAADPAKGAQKAAHAAGDSSLPGLARGLPDSFSSMLLGVACGRLGLERLRGGGLRGSRQPLARHLAGNAQSRTENAAYSLRSHTIYDGSSDAG
jgi:hypothetical protein